MLCPVCGIMKLLTNVFPELVKQKKYVIPYKETKLINGMHEYHEIQEQSIVSSRE